MSALRHLEVMVRFRLKSQGWNVSVRELRDMDGSTDNVYLLGARHFQVNPASLSSLEVPVRQRTVDQ